ncbi:uncharacterized protein LOC123370807 isoform X2 [Mauremys mutica]|uniref:uncharacterized protein LOC123370807 isoform X2 n=1 Tax=Mauremys mutica TaxID=74926 RepID=UPI001D16B37C|nr:uncharacterized protein LOC123370807 isoform X2 [Mauremys mutica]
MHKTRKTGHMGLDGRRMVLNKEADLLQRPCQRDHHKDKRNQEEAPISRMLASCLLRRVVFLVPLIFVVVLLTMEPIKADEEAGTTIPAETGRLHVVGSSSSLSKVCGNQSRWLHNRLKVTAASL